MLKKILLIIILFPSLIFSYASSSTYVVPLYWFSQAGAYNSNMVSTLVHNAFFASNGNLSVTIGPLHYDYPYIYSIYPYNNYPSTTGNEVLVCNVSDSDWLKNISFWSNTSGSWQLISTKNLTGYVDSAHQNISFNKDIAWYCYVCDELGFCTNSSIQNLLYNVSLPVVNLVYPEDGHYDVPSTLNFSCNVSSLKAIDTITIYIWKNGYLYFSNSTPAYGNNFTANFSTYLDLGNYTWNCKANNSDGYDAFADSNYSLYIISSNSPYIIEAWAKPPIISNDSTEWLFINASNSNYQYANITLPNGTIVKINLTNGANTSFNNTHLTGLYNVTFVAENQATMEYTYAYDNFIVSNEITFNLNVVNSTNNGIESTLLIVYGDWTYYNSSSPTGTFSITIPSYVYNVSIYTLSNSSISFFELLNLSRDNNKVFGVDKKESNESILYGFNSSFTSQNTTEVKLSYSPLSLPLSSIHCYPFNFSIMECVNGVGLSGSVDGNYLVFSSTTISEEGFKIMEESDNNHHNKEFVVEVRAHCIEDGVTFNITDKDTNTPVEARIYVRYDSIWSDVFYSSYLTIPLPYQGSYYYTINKEGYLQEEGNFYVEQCNNCNDDGECGDAEYCLDGKCNPVECNCGYIENHTCINYECCSDSDCSDVEFCSSENICEPVECNCGYIENHTCINYECCSDSDCNESDVCENHTCIPVDIELISENESVEGENVSIQLLINGEPAPSETIYVNGERYVTDENGYVYFVAGREDIKAVYKGKAQKIKVIPVKKILNINLEVEDDEFFKDVPIHIKLFDSKQNPIRANLKVILPDGREKEYNNIHSVTYTPEAPGRYTIKAYGKGYVEDNESIYVKSCELLSIDFGRWTFIIRLCWYLWLIIILIILLLLYLLKKKIKKNKTQEG